MIGKICKIRFVKNRTFVIESEKVHTVTVVASRPEDYRFDVKIEVAKTMVEIVES